MCVGNKSPQLAEHAPAGLEGFASGQRHAFELLLHLFVEGNQNRRSLVFAQVLARRVDVELLP